MKNKLNVLFIAYFFPPVTGGGIPGAMRVLKFLRYLDINGYVLTQKVAASQSHDASVVSDLPEQRIIRAGSLDPFGALLKFQFRIKAMLRSKQASTGNGNNGVATPVFADNAAKKSKSIITRLKDFLYNLNYFPDQASVWVLPAWFAGRRTISNHNIDVIFATGSPWSSLILGYLLSKTTGKPLIIDFRDPWMNNPFHLSKGKLLDQLANKIERRIVEHADVVSLNTEPLYEEFISRYAELAMKPGKFIVLPNGFDEMQEQTASSSETKNELLVRHAGFLYGPRDPAVLLDAIEAVNKRAAASNLSIRWIFEQIGAVSLSYDISARYKHMLNDGSFRLTRQLKFDECQGLLSAADLLVNIQPGTKTQVPSKLYDYLAVGRPILNITPADGALGKMVQKYQFGESVDFDQKDVLEEILYKKLVDQSWISQEVYINRNAFSMQKIADRLNDVFVSLT